MKKSLILTLTLALGLSVGSTVFAANPFELVPNDNWAYGAINDLNKAGVYAEYSDVNYQKGQTLTRNQIATLVAKAMANKNVTADQKATIDKLAAEYNDELVALGVTKADKVDKGINLSGQYRLRYQYYKDDGNISNNGHKLQGKVEIDADSKINGDWTANIVLEGYRNFYTDAGYKSGTYASADGASGYTGAFDMTGASVTGPVAGATMTIGKFNNTFGTGLMFDDYLSGIKFEFGNIVKTKLLYADADSNIAANPFTKYLTELNKVTSAEFTYSLSKASTLTTSFQNWTSKTSGVDSMKVYDFGINSTLNSDYSVYVTFDKTSADTANKAYVVGLSYKGADKKVAGSYGAWIDYEYFEKNTAIDTTYWANAGQKGIAAGFNYVPATNIKWTNVVLLGKALAENEMGSNYSAEPAGAKQTFFRTQIYYYF